MVNVAPYSLDADFRGHHADFGRPLNKPERLNLVGLMQILCSVLCKPHTAAQLAPCDIEVAPGLHHKDTSIPRWPHRPSFDLKYRDLQDPEPS